MKQQYDIYEIKRLLDAYYDGETSIEQEKLLCDFFTTAIDIPSELEADRQFFVAINSTDMEEVEIPANLEQQLISHIDNLEKQENRNRKKWIKPFVIISAAACVLILLTIGLKFTSFDNHKIGNNETVVAQTENFDSIKDSAEENTPDSTLSIKPIEEPLVADTPQTPVTIKKKKRIKQHRRNNTNQLKSVSDEQIAYENTERALMLLSEKLNVAQEGLNQTQTKINEVNNTINTII